MRFILSILSIIFLLPLLAGAEETIKVLMMNSPYEPVPSEKAEHIGNIKGKLFINGRFHTGSLEIIKDEKGIYVINKIPFEDYVAGVVSSEAGRNWAIEALKAQAVISRTYASYYRDINADNDYHLTSTELHQVYKGRNTNPAITYAVSETEGEILTYNRRPINAVFHATCEGKTELPEEIWEGSYPYLRSVECNSHNAPYENWRRKFRLSGLEKALKIREIKNITISSYTATGRVSRLKILSGNDSVGIEIRAEELRRRIGYKKLPSTDFYVKRSGKDIIFTGKGFGHGVGLSQWGALEMAKKGKDYRDILAHFYPGTLLTTGEKMYSHFQKKK